MPRQIKYDDLPFEKVQLSGKIFMYCSKDFNVLFPIVDLIRLLRKNTIIAYTSGKGQNIIRTYGTQYNHRVVGADLRTKDDYNEVLSRVRCIFLFTNGNDTVCSNLLSFSEKNKLPLVCYSTIDNQYHFYDETHTKTNYSTPAEVIEKMYTIFDLIKVKELSDLFPEFELLEEPVTQKVSVLEESIKAIQEVTKKERKKKDLNQTKIFDPHLNKLKKMEYLRSQKNIKYDDDLETINKGMNKLNILSKFFKK